MKIPGIINDDLYERAAKMGVALKQGTLNKYDGRVRMFCRKFPGTTKSGYALRSRIVWWVYTGEVIPSGCEWNIHHKNHNRADDRIENLEKIKHSDHTHHHHGYKGEGVTWATKKCTHCREEFKIDVVRFKDKSSPGRGKFCSQECYHSHPKNHYKLHDRSHCVNGHEYTPENTFWIKRVTGKSKGCITCRRATSRRNDRRPRKGELS